MKFHLPDMKKRSLIIIGVIIFTILVSFACWLIKFPGIRRTFIFQSTDSDVLRTETRYVPLKTPDGQLRYYIDELLLGPVSEHEKPVFFRGTRVLNAFVSEGVLYVNLSKDALYETNPDVNYNEKIELFKKNIRYNFKNIKEIRVLIDDNDAENH